MQQVPFPKIDVGFFSPVFFLPRGSALLHYSCINLNSLCLLFNGKGRYINLKYFGNPFQSLYFYLLDQVLHYQEMSVAV